MAVAANIATAADVTIASAAVEGRSIAPVTEPVHDGTVANADITAANDVRDDCQRCSGALPRGDYPAAGTQSWQQQAASGDISQRHGAEVAIEELDVDNIGIANMAAAMRTRPTQSSLLVSLHRLIT